MDILRAYWPLLVPYIIAVYTLAIVALVHVLKHPHYRVGNKIAWILIVLLVQILGPIAYFVFGKGEE